MNTKEGDDNAAENSWWKRNPAWHDAGEGRREAGGDLNWISRRKRPGQRSHAFAAACRRGCESRRDVRHGKLEEAKVRSATRRSVRRGAVVARSVQSPGRATLR